MCMRRRGGTSCLFICHCATRKPAFGVHSEFQGRFPLDQLGSDQLGSCVLVWNLHEDRDVLIGHFDGGHMFSHLEASVRKRGCGNSATVLLGNGGVSEQRILDCIFLTWLPTHHPSPSLFWVALSALPRGDFPCNSVCLAWPEPAKGSVLTVWCQEPLFS